MVRDEGFFASNDGTRLYWRSARPEAEPKAWIGVVHGYSDHCGRYQKPIEAFVEHGYAVLAFDHRGHGRADGPRGDCTRWGDYLDDMQAFYSLLTSTAQARPIFLLAHSHGGLILTHFLAGAPPQLKGAVLSAPFYAIGFEPPAIKRLAARALRRVLPGLKIPLGLTEEQLSSDPAWQEESRNDPLRLHKTTPRWFSECQAAQQRLAGLGPSLVVPLLMLTGSADTVVSTPAAKAFFETIGATDKTYKEYSGFRHEVMMEVGREKVWNDISSWISTHL